MPGNERRFWSCTGGHIMGEIKRVTVGEARVRALMLYEQSTEVVNAPGELPLLRGRLIGSMDTIRCTICGRHRNWIMGEDAMQELLGHALQSDV